MPPDAQISWLSRFILWLTRRKQKCDGAFRSRAQSWGIGKTMAWVCPNARERCRTCPKWLQVQEDTGAKLECGSN